MSAHRVNVSPSVDQQLGDLKVGFMGIRTVFDLMRSGAVEQGIPLLEVAPNANVDEPGIVVEQRPHPVDVCILDRPEDGCNRLRQIALRIDRSLLAG